jgi:hypothetical protein
VARFTLGMIKRWLTYSVFVFYGFRGKLLAIVGSSSLP